MVRAHGFYDSVQRVVITDECPWCHSIFSARLDAQHHACSSFLHGFCRASGSHVQTGVSSHCCLLSIRCVKLRKSQIKSQRPRLFHKLNLFLWQFSSVSDYYDHIIRCHLSLPGLPRARFARGAHFRCANVVPTARPFAVGNARRLEKHVPRRGSEWRTTKGWNICGPKSVIENQKRAHAWERIWRSDDGDGLSKYGRWSEWLRENTGESISRLTDTSSSCCSVPNPEACSKGFSAEHGWWRETTVRSSEGAGKGIQRGSERAERVTTLCVVVCSVRQ